VISPPRLQRAAAATTEPCPLPLIPTTCVLSPVGLGTLTAWYQQCQVLPLRRRYRPTSPPPPARCRPRQQGGCPRHRSSPMPRHRREAPSRSSLAQSIADLTRSIADTNRNVAAMQSAWATLVQPPPPPHPHLPPAPLPTTDMLPAGLSSTPLSSTRVGPPRRRPTAGRCGSSIQPDQLARVTVVGDGVPPRRHRGTGAVPVATTPAGPCRGHRRPLWRRHWSYLRGGGGGPITNFPSIPGLAPTSAAMTDIDSAAYAGPPGSAHAPPRFYKLDFSDVRWRRRSVELAQSM
jgi:hypothetical protein